MTIPRSPELPSTETKMYAVFRNGVRVSDSEYDSPYAAQGEFDYWNRLLKRWPDGSRLDVRELHYRRRTQ